VGCPLSPCTATISTLRVLGSNSPGCGYSSVRPIATAILSCNFSCNMASHLVRRKIRLQFLRFWMRPRNVTGLQLWRDLLQLRHVIGHRAISKATALYLTHQDFVRHTCFLCSSHRWKCTRLLDSGQQRDLLATLSSWLMILMIVTSL